MLYGSGIYIVSENDMPDFLNEVKKEYKDIEWFLPENYIYRYFNKNDTHKLVFLGNGDKSKSYNKHKVKQISWQNPKSYSEAIDTAKYRSKKGCRYSNNYWYVYKKSIDIESIYNILITSYDKNFAFEAFLEKIKEFGAEILSQTELKEKFITCEDYEKVRIYIKPKENKDEKSKNSKSLDELLNDSENLYGEEYFDEIEENLDSFFNDLIIFS